MCQIFKNLQGLFELYFLYLSKLSVLIIVQLLIKLLVLLLDKIVVLLNQSFKKIFSNLTLPLVTFSLIS